LTSVKNPESVILIQIRIFCKQETVGTEVNPLTAGFKAKSANRIVIPNN